MREFGHGQRPNRVRKTLLALSVVLGMEMIIGNGALADQPPPELKMILAPGSANSGAITFSAEEKLAPVRKTTPPEPVTVLPPEATADSAIQRAALVSGKSRSYTPAYPRSFTLGTGYRWDSLNWNIAGFGGAPNIRSELTFDEMESLAVSGNFHWISESKLYFRGGVEWGSILNGDAQDSDFNGNNRTLEYSRSYSDADGGTVFDASIGMGYSFEVPLKQSNWTLRIAPLVGYSYHQQDIEISDGWQLSYNESQEICVGSLAGLDSSYEAEWHGPWIGLDLELELNKRQSLRASLEYHWVDYEADAEWNLRTDLAHPISFEHESDGEGIVVSLAYKHQFESQWFGTIGAKYSKLKADSGKNIMYSSEGYWLGTRLNEAEWESCAVMGGVGFTF